METIFERHRSEAKIGDISVTIPQDISLLSMIGINKFEDKEEYKDDGWVYQDGKRKKKWFKPLDTDYRIWEPKLNDLARLERSRYHVLEWVERRTKGSWRKVFEEIKKSKPALGNFPGQDRQIVLYFRDDTYRKEGGILWADIGSDYIRDVIKRGEENQDLINKYFRSNRRTECYYRRATIFNIAFELAVHRFLFENYRDAMGNDSKSLIKLTINGRIYWFDKRELKKIAYPEDILGIDVSID